MVVEGAFGQLKGCWRILQRKNERDIATASLVCIILHSVCIEMDDDCPTAWNIAYDVNKTQKRPRSDVCDLLDMTKCRKSPDDSGKVQKVRDHLKSKLWDETHGQVGN